MGLAGPKPVGQVNAALGHLVRNAADLHVDPTALVLAGDSAGAQIAGQVALLTTNPAYAGKLGISPELRPQQLSAQLLLSGAYDQGDRALSVRQRFSPSPSGRGWG